MIPLVSGTISRLGRPIASCHYFGPAVPAVSTSHNLHPFISNFPYPSSDNKIQLVQYRYRSNRSQRGLYDGKDVRSGNNLSFSMKSTKRTFKPNVFVKKVYSETLDEMVRFHLTTSALRSIDKMGGLDNYLLSSPHVTSGEGLQVKKRIINRLKFLERAANQQ
ncbi:50S ribosomal protein L28 [Nitzschia inconspicua]|uniref:Large ribosomal subunit protein bL28m n=1 Tax=Nitzschia inconspicua TaxID=303405 RepID=A0A9K3LKC8_9STRA|nr:50S ribosomal protein L28 [Nitzschia inconspicua]